MHDSGAQQGWTNQAFLEMGLCYRQDVCRGFETKAYKSNSLPIMMMCRARCGFGSIAGTGKRDTVLNEVECVYVYDVAAEDPAALFRGGGLD